MSQKLYEKLIEKDMIVAEHKYCDYGYPTNPYSHAIEVKGAWCAKGFGKSVEEAKQNAINQLKNVSVKNV